MSSNKRQFTLTNLIQLEPLQKPSLSLGSLQNQSERIGWLFERVSTAFEVLPQLKQSMYMLQIWEASIRWQHCRAILIIHDFITCALPELSELLFETHRLDPTFLLKNYSAYGTLVNTIMSFLVDYMAQYSRKRGPRPTSYLTIPSNLFGLVNVVEPSTLKFELKNKRLDTGKVYTAGKELFLDIVTSQLVVPKLHGVNDAAMASERKKTRKKKGPKKKRGSEEKDEGNSEEREEKERREKLLDEYLLRGSVLQTIVDLMDDESICALRNMDPILYGSLNSLWKSGDSTARIAKAIRRNPDKCVGHIRRWLIEKVPLTVKNLAHDFGQEVHRSVMEYICGKSLSDAAYEGTVGSNHLFPSQPRIDDPRTLLLLDVVQSGKESISFGVLGLIVREVVREYRGKEYAVQSLRWYLEGKDHTDGIVRADGDRDQRNPIREANIGALLLQTHLPYHKLTGRFGLANLLSWHGTGQGNMTSAFLDYITRSPPWTFFLSFLGTVNTTLCQGSAHQR